MNLQFSKIGSKLASGSGIGDLMDDLGNALANAGPNLKMLGGGQPAQIPAINQIWQNRLQEISRDETATRKMLTTYDPPKGNPDFIQAIAELLKTSFHWNIGPENIALTSGGQTAFFYLFNLLAGKMPDGSKRKILFPLVPEYIGYAAQGLNSDIFTAFRPEIEYTSPHEFKYHIDFKKLRVDPDIAAICVSRPTNPTGNVISDNELKQLSDLAKQNNIPLIIDNAYGSPFPQIIFVDAKPLWEEHIILTLSLSKLGLPGTRTGIVVAAPEIISAISSMTAITGLSNPSIGQQITLPLIRSGEILTVSDQIIRPFYHEKSRIARQAAHQIFGESFPWHMHLSEGALFLWFWFTGLPISSSELYQRLKKQEVLIIPGEHFFFGCNEPHWQHRNECIRVSFAMDESTVRAGLTIIAQEIKKAFR
jgi:valine--pyruvate aminotransferase